MRRRVEGQQFFLWLAVESRIDVAIPVDFYSSVEERDVDFLAFRRNVLETTVSHAMLWVIAASVRIIT